MKRLEEEIASARQVEHALEQAELEGGTMIPASASSSTGFRMYSHTLASMALLAYSKSA